MPAPASGSSSPPSKQGCPQGTPCLNCFFKDTSVSPSRSPQVRGVGGLVGKAVLCETKDHGGRWADQPQLPPLAQSGGGAQLPSGKDSWEVDFSVHFRSGTCGLPQPTEGSLLPVDQNGVMRGRWGGRAAQRPIPGVRDGDQDRENSVRQTPGGGPPAFSVPRNLCPFPTCLALLSR